MEPGKYDSLPCNPNKPSAFGSGYEGLLQETWNICKSFEERIWNMALRRMADFGRKVCLGSLSSLLLYMTSRILW